MSQILVIKEQLDLKQTCERYLNQENIIWINQDLVSIKIDNINYKMIIISL